MSNAPRKTRTVKAAKPPAPKPTEPTQPLSEAELAAEAEQEAEDARKALALLRDPDLDNGECRAELAEDLRVAKLEVELGPDSQGWRDNETLRPAITERAAFYRALMKLLPLLLLLLCLAVPLRAENLDLSGAPQKSDGPSVLEGRSAMALYSLATTGINVANWPASQAMSVGNFPATQAVTGTFWQSLQPVSVSNFPATQPVSGTFWQSTQPVSATALPLPAGAATAANQVTMQGALNTVATNTTGAATAANQTAGNTSLSAIAASVATTAGVTANNFRNITTAATTLVKSGGGVLHAVNVNTLGTVASLVTLYDSTSASGTKIGTINSLSLGGSMLYDVAFANGLTVVTTGVAGPDITVSYR